MLFVKTFVSFVLKNPVNPVNPSNHGKISDQSISKQLVFSMSKMPKICVNPFFCIICVKISVNSVHQVRD